MLPVGPESKLENSAKTKIQIEKGKTK